MWAHSAICYLWMFPSFISSSSKLETKSLTHSLLRTFRCKPYCYFSGQCLLICALAFGVTALMMSFLLYSFCLFVHLFLGSVSPGSHAGLSLPMWARMTLHFGSPCLYLPTLFPFLTLLSLFLFISLVWLLWPVENVALNLDQQDSSRNSVPQLISASLTQVLGAMQCAHA